jgi:DNA-binding IclR family transcriptional regulator
LPSPRESKEFEMPETITRKRRSRDPVIREVPAVTRAVTILKYLARVDAPVGVVQLANALKIIPSTCLHILRVLSGDGLVSFQPATKKYQLGAGILALAKAFENKDAFVQAARPHLEGISERHLCTAVAVESSGEDHFIVVSAASVNVGMSVTVTVGTRVPAMISATGRCLAAFGAWSVAELKAKFVKLRWQNPPKFEAWYKEVEETKRRGYATDIGNYIRGITVIAAPVFDDQNSIIGALVTVQLSDQMTPATIKVRAGELQRAAAKVGMELGYRRARSQ